MRTMTRGPVSRSLSLRELMLFYSLACCCPLLASSFVLPTAAFPVARRTHSCSPRCGSWSTAIVVGGRPRPGEVGSPRRVAAAASPRAYPRFPSLTIVAGSGGQSDGGSRRGVGLDIDAESLARAREAAKNDDYDWFMEFIEGDSGVNDDTTAGGLGKQSDRSNSESGVDDCAANSGEVNNGRRRRDFVGDDDGNDGGGGGSRYWQRQPASEAARTNRRDDADRRRRVQFAVDGDDKPYGGSRSPPRRRGSPTATGEFRGSDRRAGRQRPTVAADEAYDYDLDDEFEGEPGRGGWEYDTGLAAGVGARRRDVDIGKVRARAKAAARRLPLEDEERDMKEERKEEDGQGDVEVEPIGADKATILTGDLGYTQQEVACMDRDMADLAIERTIRRPAAGMPPDWVAAGARPPERTSRSSLRDGDNDASRASSYSGGSGALNLDEMLYGDAPGRRGGGLEEEEEEVPGRRSNRPRTREPVRRGDGYWREDEDEEKMYSSRGRARRQGRGDSSYFEEEGERERERGYGRRVAGGRNEERDGYWNDDYDDNGDFEPRRTNGEGRRRRRRKGGGGAGAPPKRKLNAAEKYELKMRGGDDDEEEGNIWTGVGSEGPWPTLEEFTKLLREETDVRLSLVGPWAADVVALENKFRLDAYKKWLEVLDKGIGETLEQAGLFDAAFGDQDDDYGYDGYGDETDGRGGYGYDPRGRGGERGFAPNDRLREDNGDEEERGRDRPRRRERSARKKKEDEGPDERPKFDVGSFLRSGVESLTAPAPGMEEAAARFERSYPGRKSTDSRKMDGAADERTRQPRRDGGDGYDGGKQGRDDSPEYRRSGRRYTAEEDEGYYD